MWEFWVDVLRIYKKKKVKRGQEISVSAMVGWGISF